jgi:hypothetical protein
LIFHKFDKKTPMSITELQESIIQKIHYINDEELLDYLNQLLSSKEEQKVYKLSEFEKNMLAESHADYLAGRTISNEEVISRNEKWLNE